VTDRSTLNVKENDVIGAYRVRQIVDLPEIHAAYYRLDHPATGGQHVHIARADKENSFGVAFKTVPTDSSGVAHILEHTALCGSRLFPVRDPFFSMLKRSLSTFMNAFTASDWTMYPFSTQNRKDFYNLMRVYLDAAFFPRLDELSFKQEGHRLGLVSPSPDTGADNLVYQGVVYNEMKGAMSSPSQVMGRAMLNALYPETTYRFNSGGDPEVIPQLTHEQLVAFHQRHYHPSNAFFYTYGDLDLADHLAFIDAQVLSHFTAIDPGTEVPSQARWSAPKQKTYTYPLDKDEDPQKKCQVALAWLTTDIRDPFEVLVLTVLEQVLIGNPASPLRKALIDSQLGSALSDGSGFDADNRDTLFACGLKGVSADSADDIEAIILGVFENLVSTGIPETLIESAIHQIEFHRKEVTNSPYPYGLQLLLLISSNWFHGGYPERVLQFDADLAELKAGLKKGRFLEERLDRYFLKNPHRVRMVLAPDQQKADVDAEKETLQLQKIHQALSADDLENIKKEGEELQLLQETKEDLSCLPTLGKKDIPPDVKIINPSSRNDDANTASYLQPTSGIFYFSMVTGVGAVPTDLIWLVPFFCTAFSRAGTQTNDYEEIARRIDRYTGGMGAMPQARVRYDDTGACIPFVTVSGKCL
jgi:Zn-dependent M16 (insulinase) family peptidase